MTIGEKLVKIAQNQQNFYDAGYAAGKKEGDDAGQTAGFEAGYAAGVADIFKQRYYNHQAQQNYLYAFAGVGWNDASYTPTEDMVFDCSINSSLMYAYSNIKDTIAAIDLSKATQNTQSTFNNAKLVTIRKLIVSETTSAIGFTGCSRLVNLTVEGTFVNAVNLKDCAVLSNASVQNVIDCLKDLTGATSLKLTLHADVGAAMTQAQKAAVTAKNWTLVY